MPNAATRHITTKTQAKFIKALKSVDTAGRAVETEVIAPAYRDVIEEYFGGTWDFQENTDGFFSAEESLFVALRLLLEAKNDYDLRQVHDRAVIVAQCLFYLKRFQASHHPMPTVIFGCDRNQMFIVYSPPLERYLDEEINWNIMPSQAASQYPDLVKKLEEDMTLATFVYDINDSGFNLNDVMQAIDKLAENNGEYQQIKVYPNTIRATFESFLTMLSLRDRNHKPTIEEYESYVSLFINSLVGGASAPRVDPARKNTIHLSSGATISIDTIAYQAFFSRYETNYTGDEIRSITGMYDVLLEETRRRQHGDFWTPTIWTDKAHAILGEQLGDDWRQKYVVWDASCGTKNLTRDYADWSNLYLSTINQFELDTATTYNAEAKATFQYDFLNDDMNLAPGMPFGAGIKIDPKLYQAFLEKKPLLFLMNPPYATATNHDESSKKDVAKTAINEKMKKVKGYQTATQQLYTQFLYRIMEIKRVFELPEVAIGIFTPDRFMTGTRSFGKFIDDFQDDFEYQDGMYFNAGEFSDVSTNWGVAFTVWRSQSQQPPVKFDKFEMDLLESTDHGLKSVGTRVVHNLKASDLLSTWAREQIDSKEPKKQGLYAQLRGPFKTTLTKNVTATLPESGFGYMHSAGNSIEHSITHVGLYSSCFGNGHGIPVTPKTFERVMIAFFVRKGALPDLTNSWVTGHDNYRRPIDGAEQHPQWREFVANSVIYGLFSNNGSNESSLRNLPYKGQEVNVFNEFFFMSREDMKNLADKHGNNAVRVDANSFGTGERFVYEWLQQHDGELSAEGREVLRIGRKMVTDTFSARTQTEKADEWHLQSWDAGFTQIRYLAREIESPLIAQWREALEELRVRTVLQAERFGFFDLV